MPPLHNIVGDRMILCNTRGLHTGFAKNSQACNFCLHNKAKKIKMLKYFPLEKYQTEWRWVICEARSLIFYWLGGIPHLPLSLFTYAIGFYSTPPTEGALHATAQSLCFNCCCV